MKILFCYFAPKNKTYTPLDIGYIVSMIKEQEFDFEIVFLYQNESNPQFKKNAYYLLSKNPSAIFFFLENVVWSRTYALNAAIETVNEIKKQNKNVFIGFQSYKIMNDEIYHILKNVVDVIVRKDPEKSFLFLKDIINKKKVPGVSYYNKKTKKVIYYDENDVVNEKNLDKIKSPYLKGVFDKFLEIKQIDFNGNFLSYIQTSRGCPFGCYYCFRSVKFDNLRLFSVKRVFDEIEYLFNKHKIYKFFIIDDCFIISKKRLKEFVSEFNKRKNKNIDLTRIELFVMCRPEYIDEEIADLLKKLNVLYVQIGLQTINPDLQKYATRSIKIKKFSEISKILHEKKIKFKLDVIIGLPGDTIEYFKNTLDYAISLNPEHIQVKQLYQNPGTLFFQESKKFEIKIESKKRYFSVPYVKISKGIDEGFQKKAYKYLMKQVKNNSHIQWKWLSEYGQYYD